MIWHACEIAAPHQESFFRHGGITDNTQQFKARSRSKMQRRRSTIAMAGVVVTAGAAMGGVVTDGVLMASMVAAAFAAIRGAAGAFAGDIA